MWTMVEASPNPSRQGSARIGALGLHPIKSARGLSPLRWRFDHRGPLFDRHWMLIDANGRFLSLREVPELARLRVDAFTAPPPTNGTDPYPLGLAFDGARMTLDSSSNEPLVATLWGNERRVLDEGDEVAAWLGDRLRRDVRLVRHDVANDPWVQDDPPADGATTGLSDGYPVLILCRSTIESTLGPEWSPLRFRANLLVDDAETGAEDRWHRIRIGEVELELVKPCVRCVATTVDPERGVRDGVEPLHRLTSRRTWNGKPTLGWNALVREAGWIDVGDEIEVLSTHDSVVTADLGG